jgi:hypothetical protein
MKIQTVYDYSKSVVSNVESSDDESAKQALELINLGSQQADLEQKLRKTKSDLEAIIKTPAPQELLEDTLGAIRQGDSLKEYCKSKGKQPWNRDLYIMPESDEWKSLKKEARKVKEAVNLTLFDQTIEKLSAEKKSGNLVCTTLKTKARKQGGYSWKMAGHCGGAPTEKLSATDAFAELNKQLDDKSDSSERV